MDAQSRSADPPATGPGPTSAVLSSTQQLCAPAPSAPSPNPPSPRRPRRPRLSSAWPAKFHSLRHFLLDRAPHLTNDFKEYLDLPPETETRPRRAPSSNTTRKRAHNGTAPNFTTPLAHFKRNFYNGLPPIIPIDPGAPADAGVVVDGKSFAIYDAYILKVDTSINQNDFVRLQVVKDNKDGKYAIWLREGRVGLLGQVSKQSESKGLSKVTAVFRSIFMSHCQQHWKGRFRPGSMWAQNIATFVELDYPEGTLPSPVLPDYTSVDAPFPKETKAIMEFMLYGGSVSLNSAPVVYFTAPYQYLSWRTVERGFRILNFIYRYLDSVSSFHWKVLLQASDSYHMCIPCCAGDARPPVISTYWAIFVELRLLHSLYPRDIIASLMKVVHHRASLQLSSRSVLAYPLHHAYCSLQHGFRRLTDTSTIEFQILQGYLHHSWSKSHRLHVELKDIYRVFLKSSAPNPYSDWITGKLGDDICGRERRLLWHGTQPDSLLGILNIGLQIRRLGANTTGSMFGHGIYLADTASKSANYCKAPKWNGEAVLLLCDADIGAQRISSLKAMENGHEVVAKSDGQFRCIEGVGATRPSAWLSSEWTFLGPGLVSIVCCCLSF
jgi:poly [ADP-ribose] polymerase